MRFAQNGRTTGVALLLCALAPGAGPLLQAEEGKWTPQQVLQLDPHWLKREGLELPVARLWNPQRGTGLLSAAIALPGCSASFVSANGLILTNHHCLFSVVQEHSTPQRDLITSGFLAQTPAEELPGKTMRVTVPRRFLDVTREVESAVPVGTDDAARSQAIEASLARSSARRTRNTACPDAARAPGYQEPDWARLQAVIERSKKFLPAGGRGDVPVLGLAREKRRDRGGAECKCRGVVRCHTGDRSRRTVQNVR
jgi:hypothetical protein